MKDFYKNIEEMHTAKTLVSVLVVDGPYAREKALFDGSSYIYQSAQCPVFDKIRENLKHLSAPLLTTIHESMVFCEVLSSSPRLVICGCGHVSMPIIHMGKLLGFEVTAIDDRPSFCDKARINGADQVICDAFDRALAQIPDESNTYYVIVTRGHRYDVACLKTILPRSHAYVGMMGSRMRVHGIRESLLSEGYEQELLDSVHMPIGLRIKAETPEEIAVSILAEIIQVKNEHNAFYHYSDEMLNQILHTESPLKMAMTTIIRRRGSAPRSAGTKMLVLEDGRTIGTIGGGCAEAAVFQRALRCLRENTSEIMHVDMTGRDAEEDGMVCGGVMDVFIECI